MVGKQKTLEEQLAETQARQQRLKARLIQLEARKKAKDKRIRAYGEKALVRILLERMASQHAFKEDIHGFVTKAALKQDEREAILWVIASLDNPAASADDQSPATTPSDHMEATGVEAASAGES